MLHSYYFVDFLCILFLGCRFAFFCFLFFIKIIFSLSCWFVLKRFLAIQYREFVEKNFSIICSCLHCQQWNKEWGRYFQSILVNSWQNLFFVVSPLQHCPEADANGARHCVSVCVRDREKHWDMTKAIEVSQSLFVYWIETFSFYFFLLSSSEHNWSENFVQNWWIRLWVEDILNKELRLFITRCDWNRKRSMRYERDAWAKEMT